jgi:hypothetical protein
MNSYSPSVAAIKRPTHSPKSKFEGLTLERNDVPVRRQLRVVIRYTILTFCCFISQITVYMLGEHYKVTINQTFTSGTLDLVAISAIICISYVMIVMKPHNLKIGNFRISGQYWRDWTVASRLSEVRELTSTLSIFLMLIKVLFFLGCSYSFLKMIVNFVQHDPRMSPLSTCTMLD